MSSVVLVPGACHGGWWYAPLVDELEHAGHRARALTPAGLGPDGMVNAGQVTLDRHVAETVSAVKAAFEATGEPAVLVGHSYAGCLISGAADKVPGLIRALVYLDAFVPEDGDSCWSMTNDDQRRWYIDGAGRTGLAIDPLPFFDSRARPHPLATLVQRSTLTGAWRAVPSKTYVAALDWPPGMASPFELTTERLEADPDWTVHRWHTAHNVLRDGPARVLELLLGI